MEFILSLNFFSNFRKLLQNYRNTDPIPRKIDNHIRGILQIDSWKEMSFGHIKAIKDKNVKDNILKYSLLYHGSEWENDESSNAGASANSPFSNLILEILLQGTCFNKSFERYMKEVGDSFSTNSSSVIPTDIEIIVQTAYFHNYSPAIMKMLASFTESEKIIIPFENKNLLTLIAERGYFDLLGIYLNSQNKSKTLYQVFKDCLKGQHNCSFKNEVTIKYGEFGAQDYEKCLNLIIEDKDFVQVIINYSPMHDAVLYHNKSACNKLIAQFGLISRFLEELERSYIEDFLDSRIIEHRDHRNSEFEIDYCFMKKGFWECILISLAKHGDNKFIITHPVIRMFVDCIMKRFEGLHILNLVMYLALFVLPSVYGFLYSNFLGYLASTLFLLSRELFQYLFVRRFNVFYDFEMKELLSIQNEEIKFKEKFAHRGVLKTFYKNKTNIFESVLILVTFLTMLSLMLAETVDGMLPIENIYRILLVILILMGTVELSMLTTSVFSKLGIYMVSYAIEISRLVLKSKVPKCKTQDKSDCHSGQKGGL
jgi:hypothetical protein